MKNIKQIAHDLSPMCDVVNELSSVMCEFLGDLTSYIHSDDKEINKYLLESVQASNQLAKSIELIKKYVTDLHVEADSHGITKG